MNKAEVEQVFHTLKLETEEQRNAMRFEQSFVEDNSQLQVVTTGSTCHVITSKEHGVA